MVLHLLSDSFIRQISAHELGAILRTPKSWHLAKFSSRSPPQRPIHFFFYKLHTDKLFVHTINHKSSTSKAKKMFKFCFSVFLLSPPWALLHPVSEPTFLESRPPRVCLEFPQNQNPGPRPVHPFPTAQVPKCGRSRESPGGLDEHTDVWAATPELLILELSGPQKGPVHLPSSMFPKDADAIGAKALAWFLAGRTPAPPAHTLRGCLLKVVCSATS